MKPMGLVGKFCVLILFAYLILSGSGAAQEKPMRLNLAYSSISGSQAIVRVIKDGGIFQKNGIDVNMIFIEGGARTIQALIAGDVPIAVLSGEPSILARMRGADTTVLLGLINIMDFSIIALPEVKTPQDLKGKKIAVSRYGSSTDFVVRYALEKWGLTPERDVAILQIGSQPSRFLALKAGSVQATVVGPPTNIAARKAGFTELSTPEQLDLIYPNTCVVTTASAIARNEELVRRVVKSFVEGIHFYKTQKELSLKSVGAFVGLSDRDATQELYEDYVQKLPRVPYLPLEGIKNVLNEIAKRDPKAKGFKPETFVENRFLKELEASGVIQRLYR
jgi:NitT/TauT family transport system substrate-binding protein